jgi:DNA-binding transcriptional LysR family regulator
MNDSSTRLYRLTAEWFSAAGVHCRPRIELNYNDAIRTLVAAGYGAALMPEESHKPAPRDPRITVRPLSPALWRQLGLAVSDRGASGPTRFVLEALLPSRDPAA